MYKSHQNSGKHCLQTNQIPDINDTDDDDDDDDLIAE